jgi:hypothetical protein
MKIIMLKHFKKILLKLGKVFCLHPNTDEDIDPDDFYHSKRSAEGWELVDDFNDPGQAAAAEDTGNKTARVKSSLPPYPVVWTYFTVNGYPDAEARRFYKRFQVMGWNERIIPTLDNWPELADHWMQQARQQPNRKPPTSPPHDNHPDSDHSDTEPI